MSNQVNFNCPNCGQVQAVKSGTGYQHHLITCTMCKKKAKVETANGTLKKIAKA